MPPAPAFLPRRWSRVGTVMYDSAASSTMGRMAMGSGAGGMLRGVECAAGGVVNWWLGVRGAGVCGTGAARRAPAARAIILPPPPNPLMMRGPPVPPRSRHEPLDPPCDACRGLALCHKRAGRVQVVHQELGEASCAGLAGRLVQSHARHAVRDARGRGGALRRQLRCSHGPEGPSRGLQRAQLRHGRRVHVLAVLRG